VGADAERAAAEQDEKSGETYTVLHVNPEPIIAALLTLFPNQVVTDPVGRAGFLDGMSAGKPRRRRPTRRFPRGDDILAVQRRFEPITSTAGFCTIFAG
jgi:hypothetical protein